LQEKFNALEAEAARIKERASKTFPERTKAIGTVFLILDPDGRLHREYRIPRPGRKSAAGNGDGGSADESAKPPTSDDLSDNQLATTFTHQALAVREALLSNSAARKRLLAMILHEKIRSEALAIRPEANGASIHAQRTEGFASPAWDALQKLRQKLDPFAKERFIDDQQAYDRLCELPDRRIDDLIELLTVECLTAHPLRRSRLLDRVARQLKVDVRQRWRPDAKWLGAYQKFQLAHLIVELRGPAHAPAPEKKKSDLVASLDQLFKAAAEGKLEDAKLAAKVNGWLPANLREERTKVERDRESKE
jgi:hypothetical protein